jgi:hypothetical protein
MSSLLCQNYTFGSLLCFLTMSWKQLWNGSRWSLLFPLLEILNRWPLLGCYRWRRNIGNGRTLKVLEGFIFWWDCFKEVHTYEEAFSQLGVGFFAVNRLLFTSDDVFSGLDPCVMMTLILIFSKMTLLVILFKSDWKFKIILAK